MPLLSSLGVTAPLGLLLGAPTAPTPTEDPGPNSALPVLLVELEEPNVRLLEATLAFVDECLDEDDERCCWEGGRPKEEAVDDAEEEGL